MRRVVRWWRRGITSNRGKLALNRWLGHRHRAHVVRLMWSGWLRLVSRARVVRAARGRAAVRVGRKALIAWRDVAHRRSMLLIQVSL